MACRSVEGFQSLSKSTKREALLSAKQVPRRLPDEIQSHSTGLCAQQKDHTIHAWAAVELIDQLLPLLLGSGAV